MRHTQALAISIGIVLAFGDAAAGQFRNGDQTVLLNLPRLSPRAVVTQRVGVTDITVTFHRPRARGRTVFGDVVSYDRVWRAGANDNTVITFADPVTVENQPLAAGTYGMHMIPGKTEWTVIFSTNSTSWGSFSYTPKEDALRVKVAAVERPFREELMYEFTQLQSDAATLEMQWEKIAVPVKIGVDTKTLTLASLRRELRHLAGYRPEAWFDAARYSVENTFNYEEALTWIDRAIADNGEGFENLDMKAQILEGLGRTSDASATQAKALSAASPQQMFSYGERILLDRQLDRADAFFRAETAKHPNAWLLWYGLARTQVARGDRAGAEPSLQKALAAATAAKAPGSIAGMKRMLERLAAGQSIDP